MPSRKVAAAREGGGGASPRQFCCACICFLGSVLLVQLWVLASLVRRLVEIHRPAGQAAALAPPSLRLPAAASAAPPSPLPALAELQQGGGSAALDAVSAARAVAAVGAASKQDLALGAAVGLGVDAVLVFLASLLQASPACHVVLLTDQPPSREILQAEGIDVQRVTFEIASVPLEDPWITFGSSSRRFKLFKDYLERTGAASAYRFIQLSDVDDVAFQSDPFDWVSRQPLGLHVFSDAPGRTVGALRTMNLVEVCYGNQAYIQLTPEPFLPLGYVIGPSGYVEKYVRAVASELASHASCHSHGVEEVVHNAVLRGVAGAAGLLASDVRVGDNGRGPVWTGGHVQKAAVTLDQGNFVLNEDGSRYAVLHQYTEHEDLWKTLNQRFLKGKRQQEAVLDCSSFDVAAGDLRGFDLSHQPADSEKDCCAACAGDPACGAFVFSAGRRHCWLKRFGGDRGVTNQGDDIVCGLRKQAASMPAAPGVL